MCQVCGRHEEVDTTKAPSYWRIEKATELIPGLIDALDYDIWFCLSCWADLKGMEEETERREDYLREILHVHEEETG